MANWGKIYFFNTKSSNTPFSVTNKTRTTKNIFPKSIQARFDHFRVKFNNFAKFPKSSQNRVYDVFFL